MLVQSAKMFERECTHDRERSDIRRALRAYDPTLDCLWNNRQRQFHVVVRLRPGEGPRADGYPMPLFPVGANPMLDDVVSETKKRSLVGRSRDAASELRNRIQNEKDAANRAAADRFAPGFGEYALRLANADSEMTQRSLMQDMAREQRRSA